MAFTNVIKNGIEAHALSATEFAHGRVNISVSPSDEAIRVEITDSGKGISMRDLEKLIEFIPGNTSKKHSGTGYGLPIAKRYIEAHGGQLLIASKEDQGTTVTVILPNQPNPGTAE
jgi:two-component system cell cycle sensor histidine kinase PleC